ncbi:alpha/beta fold hydrolase [Pararhizobium antarcticum]|uniref:Lysophospholipase n=1 Tax=Pararhizobium antarcticum TaxID=1798805 RepID=A0A657LUE0_9HYPH|nr:alpha/beta hydrolase [Pararhizobium antarcticum]OJF97332.1 lysophospholipase [Pararhizobium antarcticum]
MVMEMRQVASPTGAMLALYSLAASAPARGIVLISHGLAEHAARYDRFAIFLATRGFHVYAHDHRGHGLTTAPDAPLGRFAARDGVDTVVRDVCAIRDLAAKEHPGLPIVLFGHSMGGLIALNTVEAEPSLFDAVAVWNSNFNPGLAGRCGQAILAIEKMLKGSDVPSGLLPQLTFAAWGKSIPGGKTPFDWLSHDEAEVAKYVGDPLCGFDASVSLWIDLFKMAYAGASPAQLALLAPSLPVHLVGGGEDPATNRARETAWLARRMETSGLRDVTTRIYPAMRHETLNDIGREAAMADFADWCDQVCPQQQAAKG